MAEVEDKESVARANLPYRAEYCKTSRAKCKKCTEPMLANSLKLAVMVKSRWHDGYDANFYHVDCFFRIKRPASVAEILHFETLKFEDQKMLEKAIESNGHTVLNESVSDVKPKGSSKKQTKRKPDQQLDTMNYDDFLVEYAKSGRAKCISCEEKIEKDAVRIGKLDYNAETPNNVGPVPRWYHVDCFVKDQRKIDFYGYIRKVKGYSDLEGEDRKMLKAKVKLISLGPDESPNKKIKKIDEDDPEEEKLLKRQSDRFFALREFVSSMRRKDIESMLEYMDQKSDYKATSTLVDMATDILLFGPLGKCSECKMSRGMVLRGASYICTGGTIDSPCTYETRDPKRGVPDVPEDVCERYEYLNEEYRFHPGKRIFPKKLVKAVEKKEAEDNNIVMDTAPLQGILIGVTSWNALKNDKLTVQKKVTILGGKLLTALDSSLFVILTSKSELDKNTPKIEVAKELNVPFATDEFLFDIETKEDVVQQLAKHLVYEWDGDLNERFNRMSYNADTKP